MQDSVKASPSITSSLDVGGKQGRGLEVDKWGEGLGSHVLVLGSLFFVVKILSARVSRTQRFPDLLGTCVSNLFTSILLKSCSYFS